MPIKNKLLLPFLAVSSTLTLSAQPDIPRDAMEVNPDYKKRLSGDKLLQAARDSVE